MVSGSVSWRRVARLVALGLAAAAATVAAAWPLCAGRVRGTLRPPLGGPPPRDLNAVEKAGVLRVALFPDDIAFDVRRNRPEGFAWELSGWLADRMGLRLLVRMPENPAHGLRLLAAGEVDLAATADPGPTAVGVRVEWTEPIESAHPVVVGRDGHGISRLADLRGRSLAVRRHTRLEQLAVSWRRHLGGDLRLVRLRPDLTDRHLAAGAAARRWDLALLDERRGWLEAGAFGPLGVSAPLGAPLPVRWALNAHADSLARRIGQLLDEARRSGLIADVERRYLENPLRLKSRRRPTLRKRGPSLSPWDRHFRSAAGAHGLDWRLLAAISFAESGYDPWEQSPVGAMGLLQLMPRIAAAFGADDPYDPAQNVSAGARLLVWLHAQFGDVAAEDRLAFALAAYNIGLGHMEDARRLARARGLDPNRWTGHVSEVLPLLADDRVASEMQHGVARGGVTVSYVTRVLGLYASFKRIAPGDTSLSAPAE